MQHSTKSIFLALISIVVFISGCNEQNLLDNLKGSWHLQRYYLNGKDKTRYFDTTYTNFRFTFKQDRTFDKTWQVQDQVNICYYDTVQHYDSASMQIKIDRIDTIKYLEPYSRDSKISGRWFLTNSNKFLETSDSVEGNKLYQILDHSSSYLDLLLGNEEFQLAK
jgi:hypothetical protein